MAGFSRTTKGIGINAADLGRFQRDHGGGSRRAVNGGQFAERAAGLDVLKTDFAPRIGPVDDPGAARRDEIDIAGIVFLADDFLCLAVGTPRAAPGECAPGISLEIDQKIDIVER